MPKTIQPHQLADVLPREGVTLVHGVAAESQILADAAEALGAGNYLGAVFLPGFNTRTYGAGAGATVTTFFMTPELKAASAGVRFLPFSYTEILAHLSTTRIDAALFSVSPPDVGGRCSFGVSVDFLAELWPRIPIRIAHVNPLMPRTQGHPGISYADLTAVIETPTPMPVFADAEDDVSRAIAAHTAAMVPDGATIEVGIGKAPSACMRALSGKRDLRIHTGIIGDWLIDLEAVGALNKNAPIVTGLAAGSERLYAEIASPRFEFRPVSYTHSALVMSKLERFVTINSALEIDLLGQAYSECAPSGLMSGPGGAADFARGAKLAGGLRVIVLPSDAQRGQTSRIVGAGAGRGPVSLGRLETDVVVTEHGAADLRELSHDARAEALIAIAAPAHRAALCETWARYRVEVLR
ncbi:4-hydroxybutyrate coenzyme A transferase [alpha proteobacterium U9-1i]|nr:4-hydroxybutyrate coenzyme A transferase [alpha proteobacterium U9-1i]